MATEKVNPGMYLAKTLVEFYNPNEILHPQLHRHKFVNQIKWTVNTLKA